MTTEIATHTTGSSLVITNEQSFWNTRQEAALRQLGLQEAAPADLAVFFHQAQRTGLDPFSRQIYMIGRWSKNGTKYTIQTGIEGFLVLAERSGRYRGHTKYEWCGQDGVWVDVWLKATKPAAARVSVYKDGYDEPISAVALLDEYMPTMKDGSPMGLWGKMAPRMLAKCALALGLREGFPQDLSGLYSTEEMAQAGEAVTLSQSPAAAPVAPSAKPVERKQATNGTQGTKRPAPVAEDDTPAVLVPDEPVDAEAPAAPVDEVIDAEVLAEPALTADELEANEIRAHEAAEQSRMVAESEAGAATSWDARLAAAQTVDQCRAIWEGASAARELTTDLRENIMAVKTAIETKQAA